MGRAARRWLLWISSTIASGLIVLGIVSWRLGSSLIAPANHPVYLPTGLDLTKLY